MVPCLRCGLELQPTDRFCPYCRAPAPSRRHNPTWAPEDRQLAAEDPLPMTAELGERCPRCERPVVLGDAFCSRCGMTLEDPATRAGWEPPEAGETWPTGWGSEYPVWPGRTVQEVPAFVDAAAAGRITRGVTAVLSGVAFAGVAASIAWHRALDRLVRVGSVTSEDRAHLAQSWLRALDQVALLVALAAIVLFALWSSRAYRNLPSLGARGLRWSQGDIAAAWLIPGINLVRPYRVMSDLWRGSDPDRPLHPSVSWRKDRVPLGLLVWWVVAVATPFLLVGTSLLIDPSSVPVEDRDQVAVLRLLVHAVELLTAALGFGLVGEITRRQRRRAEAIGWPAMNGYPIPLPGERVVPLPPAAPEGPSFKREPATDSSADVAGKY